MHFSLHVCPSPPEKIKERMGLAHSNKIQVFVNTVQVFMREMLMSDANI